jgi:hypothetical protein
MSTHMTIPNAKPFILGWFRFFLYILYPLSNICLIDKQLISESGHIYLPEEDFIEVQICRVTHYLYTCQGCSLQSFAWAAVSRAAQD